MSDRETLDAIAATHSYRDGFNGRLTRYRQWRLDEALADLGRRDRALEIGAGEGPITRWLLTHFSEVDAIEPADDYHRCLLEQYSSEPRLRLARCLFEDYETEHRYDAVVAAGVLEHVAEPVPFLAKASRLVDREGLLCVTVPNAESLHRRVGLEMGLLGELTELGELDRRVGHHRYYTFDTLRADLLSAGLEVVSIKGIVLKPLPNSGMDRLDEAYCDALYRLGDELERYCAEIVAVAAPAVQTR